MIVLNGEKIDEFLAKSKNGAMKRMMEKLEKLEKKRNNKNEK